MHVYNTRIACILRISEKQIEPAVLKNGITVLISYNRTILLFVLCTKSGEQKCDRKPRVVGMVGGGGQARVCR